MVEECRPDTDERVRRRELTWVHPPLQHLSVLSSGTSLVQLPSRARTEEERGRGDVEDRLE